MDKKTKRKNLHIPFVVYIFDDQQPLTNPKPYWLRVCAFNEKTDAENYILDRMSERLSIKGMRLMSGYALDKIYKRKGD